jgi:hypothetical protein
MLKVIIEILPGGSASARRTLGLMTIANLSDLADLSDYEVSASEGANPLTGTPAWTCVTHVRSHPRRQSVWKIVQAAAASLEGADLIEW